MMAHVIHGEVVVPGRAAGEALASPEPLSFWGGYDPKTGEITDRRHPLSGHVAAGKILVLPFASGSSTTSAILVEAIRLGTAPAALVSRGKDSFLALAAIVSHAMYRRTIPVLSVSAGDFGRLRTGQRLTIEEDGSIVIDPGASPPTQGDDDASSLARSRNRGGGDG